MNTFRPFNHPIARGLAAALALSLACQPGCKSKPKDSGIPAGKSESESKRGSKSSTGVSKHIKRGADINKAWKDRAAADAWLDSLGEGPAEAIRANSKDP